MQWHPITSTEQIEQIREESKGQPVVIFKHSTSCSISATAKSRLERQWDTAGLDQVKSYYLDLLSYRPVSNQIAQSFEVKHESPQLLFIKDGQCQYHGSHLGISLQEVKKLVS
ncbi:bacillithiol system redox-active protein YtxJ [Rufibacter glacialis]|uniref:Bacillithiol system redox-active protein YtxJ n=1 Tax=Rufibacter glacialis TaxID=1259555 RepID=A0A5M8Q5C5_9BACT|nr:bacillithiol system redox-active protein YtxJ [Rufibacter glacialis]KAA6431087.1 bacillithiol system redox-active protein YtxJ [Rufibacter glacialis]GGK83914.1 thioredoxin family protein [Rufibacter glacialis]